MKYIADNLLPGEIVVYRTKLNPVFANSGAIRWASLCVVCIVFAVRTVGDVAGFLGLIAFAAGLLAVTEYIIASVRIESSAFAITAQRIIVKTGWIRRQSLEVYVAKIEGISVDQDAIGRIFDFGDITVRGTGGTRERFRGISAPFEFRRQVQERIPLNG